MEGFNVQVVMEKFHGGGHLNNAGAQIESNDINEVDRVEEVVLDEVANSEEENKELPQKPTNGELYPKMKKVADCNKDLELEQANNLIYHKKTRKPFTGSCVSYYDKARAKKEIRLGYVET